MLVQACTNLLRNQIQSARARVAELADAQDLKSCEGFPRVGSSPSPGTCKVNHLWRLGYSSHIRPQLTVVPLSSRLRISPNWLFSIDSTSLTDLMAWDSTKWTYLIVMCKLEWPRSP